MSAPRHHLAIDLGASNGRVAVVGCTARAITVDRIVRFPNAPIRHCGLRWDIDAILESIITGIAKTVRDGLAPVSVAVDSWGVDYAWIGPGEQPVDHPYCYRDPRTAGLMDRLDQAEAFRITGIPGQPINTSTQLLADRMEQRGGSGHRLAFLPDLIAGRLSGRYRSEATIASTSQLLDARTGLWSSSMIEAAGISPECLPSIEPPGPLGPLRPPLRKRVGVEVTVHTVAAHDTAAALVAAPILEPDSGYVSLGTWACVGTELTRPLLDSAAATAGFANERGLDGTITFHRSAMGLHLLQQCLPSWPGATAAGLLRAAAAEPRGVIIDPDHPSLFAHGEMPRRIQALCRKAGGPVPERPTAIARCIVDSLAAAIAADLRRVAALTGRDLRQIQVIGGGSRSATLCQAIADAAEIPVVAGPAEAAAIGNALVQFRDYGGPTTLTEMRQLVARSFGITTHRPRPARQSPQSPKRGIS